MRYACPCAAAILLFLSGCDLFPDGSCAYDDTAGKATIVSVETAGGDDANCTNDPVAVVFNFTPDETGSADLATTGMRLTIGEGLNPPRSWVAAEGLTVGSQHNAIRRDILKGTCTPLLFSFPDLDMAAGVDACDDQLAPAGFTLRASPQDMTEVISGQVCVLLITVENDADVTGDTPVTITATANDAHVTVEHAQLRPGEVCEVTVAPAVTFSDDFVPVSEDPDFPMGEGVEVLVAISAQRAAVEKCASVSLNVLPGEDDLEEYATQMRDLFIPYLASEHPEMGITAETEWTPTIVRPGILVVSHYLFFSDAWEMSVMWHVMIPPYNWANVYLRPRYASTVPEYAFTIESVTAEPPMTPVAAEVPEEIDR